MTQLCLSHTRSVVREPSASASIALPIHNNISYTHWTGILDYSIADFSRTGAACDEIIQLVFEDGCLDVARVILCGLSGLRQEIRDCDIIICQTSVTIGQHLLDLILKGQTEILTSETLFPGQVTTSSLTMLSWSSYQSNSIFVWQ